MKTFFSHPCFSTRKARIPDGPLGVGGELILYPEEDPSKGGKVRLEDPTGGGSLQPLENGTDENPIGGGGYTDQPIYPDEIPTGGGSQPSYADENLTAGGSHNESCVLRPPDGGGGCGGDYRPPSRPQEDNGNGEDCQPQEPVEDEFCPTESSGSGECDEEVWPTEKDGGEGEPEESYHG